MDHETAITFYSSISLIYFYIWLDSLTSAFFVRHYKTHSIESLTPPKSNGNWAFFSSNWPSLMMERRRRLSGASPFMLVQSYRVLQVWEFHSVVTSGQVTKEIFWILTLTFSMVSRDFHDENTTMRNVAETIFLKNSICSSVYLVNSTHIHVSFKNWQFKTQILFSAFATFCLL